MTGVATRPPPLHAGEIAVQQRAGVHEVGAARAAAMMREHLPDQHRELFGKLPSLLVGSLDEVGRPWASMLVGRPGFVSTPDARHLRVQAQALPGDSLAAAIAPGATGAPLGLLGLEPQTRRRNRMNGTVVAADTQGFTLQVDQSFGNCPRYIQARQPSWVAPTPAAAPEALPPALHAAARALLAAADTVYLASAAAHARGHGGAQGVDVSHRGGKPGFVHVEQQGEGLVLTLPDFNGNLMFNTLGNIAANPRAGLLVVGPESGDVLQLSGSARIVWEGERLRRFAAAERLVELRIEAARWWPAALPLRWGPPQYAAQLQATGAW